MVKDRVREDIGARDAELDWTSIDWRKVERRVSNLRQRIFRAIQQCQWNKARSLMKLMLRSYSNLLISVRKISQVNRGKSTPGVDKYIALTAKARARLVKQMQSIEAWKAKPARRLFIPKADGKQRPLGIPTLQNRVAQGIVKNALEPAWEAQFESNSYGFRPGRSCHDAIEHCFRFLNKKSKAKWVLDADIKAAFDKMDHDFILKQIGNMPGRRLIKAWLKAGYVEAEVFHDTEYGVPQGGVISPLLANIALDGLQKVIGKRFGFVRYADDFIITSESKEALEDFSPTLIEWLEGRGLELNKEKTKIVHISDGFNFLGFNVRQYGGKCLIKPEMAKVRSFLRTIRAWLKSNAQATTEEVVFSLNSKILGWGRYYEHAISSQVFGYVKTEIWRALWRWCLRRHPKKGKRWIKRRYFTTYRGKDWRFFTSYFSDGETQIRFLEDISELRITRHIKVRGTHSPDDPSLRDYWAQRRQPHGRMRASR